MTVLDEFVRTNFDVDAEAIGPLKQVLVLDPGLFIVPLHERLGQVIAEDTTEGWRRACRLHATKRSVRFIGASVNTVARTLLA
jgi:hypothetical protein